MLENLANYVWADQDYDLAWTVAVISGRDVADVIRLYGGDPQDPAGRYTFGAVPWIPDDELGDFFYLQTVESGGRVVAIEKNGWAGMSTSLARHASRAGQFFAAYWTVEGRWRIVEASNGALTADLDVALLGDDTGSGGPVPVWAARVDWPESDLGAACLAALDHRTGVAFDRAWLERELPTYRIPHPRTLYGPDT